MLNKGAIWTYWEGAYRDTGRDEGATLVIQTGSKKGWFWYIPLHDNIVSVGVVAPFDYLFKGRGRVSADVRARRSTAVPASRSAWPRRRASPDYFATKDYSYRSTRGGRRRLGAGRRRVRLSRSAVLVGRAAGAQVRASWPPTPIVEGLAKGDTSAAQLGKWGPASTRAWTACAGWCASTTTASTSARWSAVIPSCSGTLTDLLIGDLFTDRVDKVWQPLESLYPAGQVANSHVGCRNAGAHVSADKHNELMLPEGRKP